ncbi:hypothetical protein H7J86_00595 [Mycobacterium hackensackense]|uniref:MFS transporter n=1 Tax=Mycobacterium hackensackense TaxID=228909 RepID=UPI002265F921|nr:MFS transporter [Mycobacterium hackensackense]MCV7250658.1 hypothetical protein [Mycobacterium hackensackense]
MVVTRESAAETGTALRCGSVFNRDQEALDEYRRMQEGSELEAAPQALKAVAQGGANEKSSEPEDLGKQCKQALSTRLAWTVVLWVAALLFVVAAVLVWRWKPTSGAHAKKAAGIVFAGARMPEWMRTCPDWVTVFITLLAGFTGLFTSIYTDNARLLWFAITAGLVLLAGAIAIARDDERRRQEQWIDAAEENHRKTLRELLGRNLNGLLVLVAEAASTANLTERKKLAHSARAAILAAAANLVGPKSRHGTQAHLYRYDAEQQTLSLEPGGSSGGEPWERVFGPDHPIYQAMLDRQGFFAGEPKDLPGGGAGLDFETCITYSIHVPNRIHGVLVVDCPRKGDLVEEDDLPMMLVLTRLMAVTYECEKYSRPRI